jgi:hypothetical protein
MAESALVWALKTAISFSRRFSDQEGTAETAKNAEKSYMLCEFCELCGFF